MTIVLNAIQCVRCEEVIRSTHRHDFRRCKCGRVAVDGGHDYLKRLFKEEGDFLDLSIEVVGDGA